MPDEPRDDADDTPVPLEKASVATDADILPPGSVETPAPAPAKSARRTPLWLETGVLLVVALGMALIIKTFFIQAFYIPSPSMEPGLIKNDRILVEKPSYWFGGSPQRGDVIVFKDPANWLEGEAAGPSSTLATGLEKIGLYPSGGHLVKRVIGLPGDKIVCCDDTGKLMINGVAVDESDFVRRSGASCDGPMVNSCAEDWMVARVPDGMLFVMGDNRYHSADSSAHLTCPTGRPGAKQQAPAVETCTGADAFVPEDDVVGKVFDLVWPIKRFTFIGRPDAFDDVPSE